jgi:hypothetical protein
MRKVFSRELYKTHNRSLLILSLVLGMGRFSGIATDSSNPVWGKPIAASAFDEKPFREVVVQDWVQEITRYAYMGPQDLEEASACGVQMCELAVASPQHVYWDSKRLARDTNLPPNLVAKKIAMYKAKGLRVIAAIPPCLQAQAYRDHPDWRVISGYQGAVPEVDLQKRPEGGNLCQLGPWGDFFIELLCECLEQYPELDGFGFDGIHHGGFCHCVHCSEAYRKEAGSEIPHGKLTELEMRRYQLFIDRRMERFLEKMQTRLRSIKPGAALVTWTTQAGRFGHLLEIPRSMSTRMNLLFDAPAQEFWMDESNRGTTIVPAFANAYLWAVSNHRQCFSEAYMMSHGNPYGTDSFPPHESLTRALFIISQGPQASISMGWNERIKEGVKQAFVELKRRSPWLTHKQPEPWAALLMSDQTRVFYGLDSRRVEERYLAHVFGAFRAAMEEHLPVSIINDWNLNAADLAPYKLLVLPNAACLGSQQVEVVRKFVAAGGGLVASLDASLCDELGNPRKDFALADVFGAHFRGAVGNTVTNRESLDINFLVGVDESYWARRRNIFKFGRLDHPVTSHPLLDQYLGKREVTFKGAAVAVEPIEKAGSVIGTLRTAEEKSEPTPAILAHPFGQGKVVYLPAGLDSAYYLYPYPYQRLVLAQAMRWAAAEPFHVKVDAPMCVQATFFRQHKDGERLVVHLFNGINSTAQHAFANDDVPLREESVPVCGIKLRFENYRIKRIHLEPEGTTLEPVPEAGALVVSLPPLAIHYIVVAEL